MKPYIDFTARPTETREVLHGERGYLEWQSHSVDPPGISYTYVTPLDGSSFVTSVCWDDEFDKLVAFIFHPQLSQDWMRAYGEVWPTFGELITNAMARRYSAPSLVNFTDPDDGRRKWHVASFVGNTTPKETYEAVADDPRVGAAAQLVMSKSLDLLQEMSTGRAMSTGTKMKLMAKSAFASQGPPVYNDAVWLSDLARLAWR